MLAGLGKKGAPQCFPFGWVSPRPGTVPEQWQRQASALTMVIENLVRLSTTVKQVPRSTPKYPGRQSACSEVPEVPEVPVFPVAMSSTESFARETCLLGDVLPWSGEPGWRSPPEGTSMSFLAGRHRGGCPPILRLPDGHLRDHAPGADAARGNDHLPTTARAPVHRRLHRRCTPRVVDILRTLYIFGLFLIKHQMITRYLPRWHSWWKWASITLF